MVVGRWELRGKWSSDAVSTVLDLLPGGWYSQTLIATAKLRYDYDGKQLVLTPLGRDGKSAGGQAARLAIRFEGDTLVATTGKDVIRMMRVGGDPSSRGLIGRWMSTNDEGRVVMQDIGWDGYIRVETILGGEAGRYRVARDDIELEPRLPLGSKRKSRFHIKGDTLVLAQGGNTDQLIRLR